MNITHHTDKGILYIGLEGRIDASNSQAVEDQITEIKASNPGLHTVLDADRLEYISSAGLRVVLKLRKEEADLAIINVSSEVYEIFDMTGFTEMVKIQKAFRRLSLEGCEFLAKGANGAVYRYDEETIVKTYFSLDALPDIQKERENARKAFVLGINTAIPYDIVRVGEGYGSVMELLSAKSITKMLRADGENIEEPANYFIGMLKNIHSTEVKPGEFADMKKIGMEWVNFVYPHLPEELAIKLRTMVENLPERNTLIHGDYHSGNVMVEKGEAILIDMDTLCMGHPIFELGSMYNAFVGFGEVDHEVTMRFQGYPFETAVRFWKLSLKKYLETEDEALLKSVEDKARVIGYTRLLRRAIRRLQEPDSPAMIAHCQKMLAELIPAVDTLEF